MSSLNSKVNTEFLKFHLRTQNLHTTHTITAFTYIRILKEENT